jgi:galactonate dehydratase
MKIRDIKTYLVGNPWKNWLFVRVESSEGVYGTGGGTLGHFSKTIEAAIHEMKPLVLGFDVFQTEAIVLRLFPGRVCGRPPDQNVRDLRD